MKVRVTFEVDDNDRLMIGSALAEDGTLRQATHEELVEFIGVSYDAVMEPKRKAFREFREEFVARIQW